MGCKESKHIATDNTIITRTSSTKSTNRGQDDNDKNNVQTLQRSRSERTPMQKQESLKEINVGDSKANYNVLHENEKSGNDKGTENEKGGGKLKEKNDEELIKKNGNVGDEAVIKEKEDQNGDVGDNGGKESILISKEDLPSTSTKDGENIVAINTDGLSGASVYSTPTEVGGAFDNTKPENAEEKKEPVDETKDTKTGETPRDDLSRIVDANPKNHVRVQEAEVEEKIKLAEAAVATPENHQRETEVEEKIKDAEAAVESLEKLVKEVNKGKEYLVTEAEATTNSSVQNLEKEADISEAMAETQVAATDAAPQNPAKETDKTEENPGTETKANDATLQNVVTESDKAEEPLIKETDQAKETLIKEAGEAVENGVKEIHEVTGKAEEIPVKELETSHETDHEKQVLVADKAEEVLDKIEEAGYATPVDPVKEAEAVNTGKENLVTVAEAANKTEEKPVNELESVANVQSQDAAKTEEDTKSSTTADGRQISKEDPGVQINTDDIVKQ